MPRKRSRVTLAVVDPKLRKKMLEILESAELDVSTPKAKEDLLRTLEESKSDLVVVRERQLDSRTDLLDSDDSGVVVLTEDGDPESRTSLMAAGASGVISLRDSPRQIADAVTQMADAERAGGVDGPEVGGHDADPRLADFQSRSPKMRDFIELVRRVADSDSSLLITGETGVGKERLARAMHTESRRSGGPFVSVNCGALPEQLLESELFGHEAGAFTGAHAVRRGRFELADGGSIFLDEIGEMPNHLQVRLLTVLQRHEVMRLGGEKEIRTDVRIMAATNRDIQEEIDAGRLREDLYYRLNVVSLHIPPLRERREDLPELLGRFLYFYRNRMGKERVRTFRPRAMEALLTYDWPGNVRELINVVERSMLVAEGSEVRLADLPAEIRGEHVDEMQATSAENLIHLPLKDARQQVQLAFERDYLDRQLRAHEGRIDHTAEAAGISTRALYDKMRRHGLDKDDYRPGT